MSRFAQAKVATAAIKATVSGVTLATRPHPRIEGCKAVPGYCADKAHRLRNQRRFTNPQHMLMSDHGVANGIGLEALIALAGQFRRDPSGDRMLRLAAADSIDELHFEVHRQQLHKVAGIQRYLNESRRQWHLQRSRARAALLQAVPAQRAAWWQPELPFADAASAPATATEDAA